MNTYDLDEAAAIAKVNRDTLRKMACAGTAPATKIGRRWIFPESLLRRWLTGEVVMPKRQMSPETTKEEISIEVARQCEISNRPFFKQARRAWEREQKRRELRKVSYSAIRGRQRRKATPKWADREAIAAFYLEARRASRRTGRLHCVDHIVPLMHPLVCGLHVHYNMQVLTVVANSAKSNKHG